MTPSRSEFITVRGLRTHVRHWGREGAPIIFMVHGWMDVGASFQFVADNLQGDWHVIAPDWRGFGLSERISGDTYYFPDYLGDLDAMLDHYSPREPVNLLGHSMGGNVVGLYAGVRPERVRRLINLEGVRLEGGGTGAGAAPVCALAGRLARNGAAAHLSLPGRGGRAFAKDQSAPVRRARGFPGAPLVGPE